MRCCSKGRHEEKPLNGEPKRLNVVISEFYAKI